MDIDEENHSRADADRPHPVQTPEPARVSRIEPSATLLTFFRTKSLSGGAGRVRSRNEDEWKDGRRHGKLSNENVKSIHAFSVVVVAYSPQRRRPAAMVRLVAAVGSTTGSIHATSTPA